MHVTFCINSTFFLRSFTPRARGHGGPPSTVLDLIYLTTHLSLLSYSSFLFNYSFIVCDETLNIPGAPALAPRVFFFISSFSLLFSALCHSHSTSLIPSLSLTLNDSSDLLKYYPYCYEQNEERKRFTRSLRCDASRRHSEAGWSDTD